MAAAGPLQNIKERATCPICLELFRDPVMGECGHSFCRECIARLCQGDGDVTCPQCRKKFRKGNLRPNWELRNMVESLPPLLRSRTGGEPRGGDTCERHRQPLQLYCREDQTPICMFCERSQAHRGHSVVLVEEVVQEHWETLTKQLAGMESTYGSLHPLVSMDRKHLSPSAGEEMHKRLKRLAENLATLWKVHTEGPGQRSEDAVSQTQRPEPDWRGVSPGREAAGETESQGPAGREPGSEPAAEKQEETRTHVVHVCEEAPTPKYGLDQATLDPTIHLIKNTADIAEPKVDGKSLSDSPQALTFVKPVIASAEIGQVGVSAVPVGRAAWGRGGPVGEAPEEQEATETPLSKEAAPPSPGAGNTQQDLGDASAGGADAPSRGDSLQDQTPAGAALELADSGQVNVSDLEQGTAKDRGGPGGEAPEKQEATETPLSKEAAPLSPGAGNTQQGLGDASAGGADAPSRGDSFQSQSPVRPASPSGGSRQDDVSDLEQGTAKDHRGNGRVARPPELQGCAVEVTLDPATAHPRLRLSEDWKSATRRSKRQDLPNTPERFNTSACVVGSKGFTSGKRYWEVEVGPEGGWAIGVARDSVLRKGEIQLKPYEGIWALNSSELSQVPRKVGVYLDYEGGEVRFYNAETMALISSLTATFTGRLVPFFHLRSVGSRLLLSPCQR